MKHIPVMLKESLDIFEGKKLTRFFEATVGAGGFAKALLEKHPEITTYYACDRDEHALEIARENLLQWEDKISFIHGNFSNLDAYLEEESVTEVDGFFLTWECHPCS